MGAGGRQGFASVCVVWAALFCAGCERPAPAVDARPDFSGTWGHAVVFGLEFVRGEKLADGSICVFGCSPQPPDGEPPASDFPNYKPEHLAKVEQLSKQQLEMDTILRCRPPGVPRIGPPAKIIQTPREIVFLYDDYNGSFFRVVPLDGRPHRADASASYLGDAIGRFENGELIVETVNFTDDTWLTDNGAFHSRHLKVVERLRRVGDALEYQATAYDPDVLAEPWSLRPRKLTRSPRALEESPPCDERDLQHMTDDSHHENPR